MRILLIEDEIKTLHSLRQGLEEQGWTVNTATDGETGFRLASQQDYDVVISDITMPGLSGLEMCHALRKNGLETPILLLTALGDTDDKVTGFEAGADDYLTKPFNLEELLLRVNKLIRKSGQIHGIKTVADEYRFGKNKIDFKGLQATNKKGELIELTKKEAMLLKLLIENRNEVVPREKILQSVWGYNVYPTTRTIDNFILNFRKYFEDDSRNPAYFHSVRGVGYKFTED